jgi:two-component system, response regulator
VSVNPLILLVDDSSDDVDIALRALRRAKLGAEIRTVRDGSEALEALRPAGVAPVAAPLRPRVIFLDLRMPQIDGFELLRLLRLWPETREIPVVVLSSSARSEDIRRSYQLGANSYLVKQFEPGDPGAFIAVAARYWIELNRIAQAG